MNYTQWINIIGLAIRLLMKTGFGEETAVRSEWLDAGALGFRAAPGARALLVTISRNDRPEPVARILLLPWGNWSVRSDADGGTTIGAAFRFLTFTHADVMGSGRFFYVDRMEKEKIAMDGER